MTAAPIDAILLLGPTASGKSGIAMALAARWPLEIVSVDSALIYRGMDVGTAKPTPAERRAVPHHLIDLLEPTGRYSAAAFARDARAAIAAIRARGRLPLLAGGTMLYAKALAEGLDDLPQADPTLRAELDADARRDGWPAMHARLARVDPVTAARLEPGDAQRVQRALEVHVLTGRPMSALLGARAADGPPPRLATIALEPSDRAVLHARIAERFGAMLAAGLLDEVRALRARGDLSPSLPSMRCVGYRQAWAYLDDTAPSSTGERPAAPPAPAAARALASSSRAPPGGRADTRYARFVDEAVAATRQLAKRQLTWLRAMPARTVVDCLAPDALEQVSAIIDRHEPRPAREPS